MRGVEVAGIEEPAGWQHCATLTAAALSWSSVNYSNCVSLRPLSIHPARPDFPLKGGAATNWFLVHGSPHPVLRLYDIFASLCWRNRLSNLFGCAASKS